MYKVLIVGCGNIGAMYDWDTDTILTHAKAFTSQKNIEVSFFDIDTEILEKVRLKYDCPALSSYNAEEIAEFDCINICTPTITHYEYLKIALKAGIKVIVCEKPVAYNKIELEMLENIYYQSGSKIVVNYIRRFQPAYYNLRESLQKILLSESIRNISIRYQRGLINNCSHALDVLQYLVNSSVKLTNVITGRVDYDCFDTDPTVSLICNWGKWNLNITGLTGIHYPQFEIDIYLDFHKIQISNSGNSISVFNTQSSKNGNSLYLDPNLSSSDCMYNYMVPVSEHVLKLLNGDKTTDNFIDSVILNKTLLDIINNGKACN